MIMSNNNCFIEYQDMQLGHDASAIDVLQIVHKSGVVIDRVLMLAERR